MMLLLRRTLVRLVILFDRLVIHRSWFVDAS